MREKILEIINTLKQHPRGSDERVQLIKSLGKIIYHKGNFSIDALVYGRIHSRLKSIDDDSILDILQAQINSNVPYWHSYAIRHNFVAELPEDSAASFHMLGQLLQEISSHPDQTVRSSEYQLNLSRKLIKYQRDKICILLPDVIIAQAIQILLNLPASRNKQFTVRDTGYSVLFPKDTNEDFVEHLNEVEKRIDQIKGDKTVFVDMYINVDGYIFSVR